MTSNSFNSTSNSNPETANNPHSSSNSNHRCEDSSKSNQRSATSRIPVSPTNSPFRRSSSLRLRGPSSNLSHWVEGSLDNGPNLSTLTMLSTVNNGTRPSLDESKRISTTGSSLQSNLNPRTCEISFTTAESSGETAKEPQLGDSIADKQIKQINNNSSETNCNGCISGSHCKANGGCSPIVEEKPKTCGKRDTNGMSLNLNGQTTTKSSGSSSATTTPSTTKTPAARTPKTPSGYSPKTPLATVPETRPTPKTPPVTPDSPSTYLDDDLDSMYSYTSNTSGRSTMSCDHPFVARNGTTFSGRKMKYVVHCSSYAGQVGHDYLTPTQRAQRQIRKLKELLTIARQDLEQKDSEIVRLTREVVELRLFKASLSSPEDKSNSSDAVTVREADLKTSQDVSPIVDMVDDAVKSSPRHILHAHHSLHHQSHLLCNSEMQSSYADSGHFEDMTTSSIHSKDSYVHTQDQASGSDNNSYEEQRQELIRMYEKRIEELIKTQDAATSDIKQTHNDRVEALLVKLAECNTRYADIVPDYEQAKERIRELEKQLGELQRKLQEHEEKQNKMYLHMYQKGQEAERIARADQAIELAHRAPNKVSITELLQQLQSTQDELENIRAAECRSECGSNHALLTAKEAISLWVLGARKTIYRRLLDAQKNKTHVDPEVTLQFLKSAIYYFLTDKENSQGHLNAIESILEFTEQEKSNINKALLK